MDERNVEMGPAVWNFHLTTVSQAAGCSHLVKFERIDDMLEIKIDTSKMERALSEFADLTRKDFSEVMKKQAGIMVGQLIGVTPPGHAEAMNSDGGITTAAKKSGEARIASDIAKLFPTTKLKEERVDGLIADGFKWESGKGRFPVAGKAFTMADLKKYHSAARNRANGRTSAGRGANMAVTRRALRTAYIKQQQQKVGMLAAGWIRAADELGTSSRRVPNWIRRHGAGPGGADINDRGGRINIRLFNSNAWFGPGMDSRVRYVVSRNEKGALAQLNRELIKRAKAAERRMAG
jgi:hypothetical protein